MMMKTPAVIAAATLLFVGSGVAGAQEKKEPPRRSSVGLPVDSSAIAEKQLPQIDLPEFAITGTELINLPEFAKTSIEDKSIFDAFARKPQPGMRESSRVELGAGTKEQIGLGGIGDGLNGRVIGGYGSYRTPYFDGWFGRSFGSSDFLLKGGYKSSGGHVDNADFRKGHSSLSGGLYLPSDAGFLANARARGSLGFEGSSYRFYGSAAPTVQRSINRFLSEVTVNSNAADLFTYASGLYLRTTSSSVYNKTQEVSAGFEFTAARDFDDVEIKGDLGLWRSFYSSPSVEDDPYVAQVGLSAKYRIAEQLDLMGGASFHLFRGSDTKSLGRLYPRLALSWYTNHWLTLFARFDPYVQRNTLSNTLEENPYVVNDVRLRHTEYRTNFSLGAEADIARVKTRLSLNYKQARNFLTYADPTAAGMWNTDYADNVRILSLDAELFADITDQDNIGASGSVRSGSNRDLDKAVPYFPSVVASALYQHRFPFGLTLGSTVQILGRRYTDLLEGGTIDPVVILDLKAEYLITSRWTVALMLNNLLDQKEPWWQGYARIPRNVAAALSFSW
jgi:hypothetical protein